MIAALAASAPAVLAGVAMTATWRRTRSLASLVVDLPAEFWLIKDTQVPAPTERSPASTRQRLK
ncbi:MAG: hypothetical protein WAV78_26670, partial [Xanthobacteraceae bacterium]